MQQGGCPLQVGSGGSVGAVGIAAKYRFDNILMLLIGVTDIGRQEWDTVQ